MGKGSSFKSDAMKKQLEDYNIKLDSLAIGNHRTDSIAQQTIQEVNGRINVMGLNKWMKRRKPAQILFGEHCEQTSTKLQEYKKQKSTNNSIH